MLALIIAAVCVCVLLIGLFFAAGHYFYQFALNTRRPNKAVDTTEAPPDERTLKRRAADDAFLQAAERVDAYVPSFDGLRLHTLVYDKPLAVATAGRPAQPRRWAVVVHGYTSKADEMTHFARMFQERGFCVLTPDLRGHGQSEGGYAGMGWHDRLDLLRWIHYILEMDADAHIVLYGLSMGAAAVMMTAGEPLPGAVKAAVEDCGYTSVRDIFAYQLNKMFHLPAFPALYAAGAVTRLRAGYGFREGSAVKQLARCKIPVLFIHGGKDSFVPFAMQDSVYNACPSEKERLIIENAGHYQSAFEEPERYWNTVLAFCERYA